MTSDRDRWYQHGLAAATAHPPSDSGSPEEWPTLYEAFRSALAAARSEVVDEAMTILRSAKKPQETGP